MKSEDQQRVAPARARDELAERLDDRVAQRARRAARRAGSFTTSVITRPGSMNSAVTTNTGDHGMWSARISASEPGHEARDAVRVDVDRVAERRARRRAGARGGTRPARCPGSPRRTRPPRAGRRWSRGRACGATSPNAAIDASSATLRQQHPAAAAAEQRQRVAVEQRRPQELPRVRKLDQREQADRLEVDAFACAATPAPG